MKVIYTDSPRPPKPNEVYRLLSPFFGVVSGATSVAVEGSAPHIEQAYRKAGVAVIGVEAADVPEASINEQDKAGAETVAVGQADVKDLDDMTVDELRAYLTDLGVEFDSKAKKADLLKLAKEQ